MKIVLEVLNNNSSFDGRSLVILQVEGTEEYCEGYVDGIQAIYPEHTVISRQL